MADDYAKALKLFMALRSLVAEYNGGCDFWEVAKSNYETDFAAIEEDLKKALAASAPTDELSEPQDAIKKVDDERKQAVTDLDFPAAFFHVEDLAAKLGALYQTSRQAYLAAKDAYGKEESKLRPDIDKAMGLPRTDPEIKARVAQIADNRSGNENRMPRTSTTSSWPTTSTAN